MPKQTFQGDLEPLITSLEVDFLTSECRLGLYLAQLKKDVNIIFILKKLTMICIISVKKGFHPLALLEADPGGVPPTG